MSAPLSPERLAEIRDLLKYESSIAFYSHRAKESMLLLLAEAEEVERLRAERDQFADRIDTLTAVAKGNKRHVIGLTSDLAAAQHRIAELEAVADAADPTPAIRATVRDFDFSNYGLDDVDPRSEYAEWVGDLASAIAGAISATAEAGEPR
ncbi:hypothetical protein ACIO6U_03050 [Streptomyces sp. NPDC087422]|uniref:hypothetical protein n=1 Tax=Streptomyces sp. NPDC087422 TaxID=3365786 RepID=UPI00381B622E